MTARYRSARNARPSADAERTAGVLSREDRRILCELQRDGLMSNQALGEAANISESTAARHRHQLEHRGLIERYAAVVNVKRMGYRQRAFVDIDLASQREDARRAFEAAVLAVEEVTACYAVAGDRDYLLHVVSRDAEDYERIRRRLAALPGVEHAHTRVVLADVLSREVIPPP